MSCLAEISELARIYVKHRFEVHVGDVRPEPGISNSSSHSLTTGANSIEFYNLTLELCSDINHHFPSFLAGDKAFRKATRLPQFRPLHPPSLRRQTLQTLKHVSKINNGAQPKQTASDHNPAAAIRGGRRQFRRHDLTLQQLRRWTRSRGRERPRGCA